MKAVVLSHLLILSFFLKKSAFFIFGLQSIQIHIWPCIGKTLDISAQLSETASGSGVYLWIVNI